MTYYITSIVIPAEVQQFKKNKHIFFLFQKKQEERKKKENVENKSVKKKRTCNPTLKNF